MLKSSFNSSTLSNEIETKNQDWEALSQSLDGKHLKRIPIAPSHKLKTTKVAGLLKKSSSVSINLTTVCRKCKSEESETKAATFHQNEPSGIPEKEVEVKKEKNLIGKKVSFVEAPFENESSDREKVPSSNVDKTLGDSLQAPASVPVFFHHRKPTSIIGNNEFWLPNCSISESNTDNVPTTSVTECPIWSYHGNSNNSENIPASLSSQELKMTKLENKMTDFFNNIFKETTKRHAKILQVSIMVNSRIVTLTNEYVFECRYMNEVETCAFEIMSAIPLKDVQKIMVEESGTIIVLQVGKTSFSSTSSIEFKEFVPGLLEKTERFVSLIVYAISRIRSCLSVEVIRLHLLSLPIYETVTEWLQNQREEAIFCGSAIAKHASDIEYASSGECFMIRMENQRQFHPVLLHLSNGQISTTCTGSCKPDLCKHSINFILKDVVLQREEDPRPNSIVLNCSQLQVTIACPTKESVDLLTEEIYVCRSSTSQGEMETLVCILVTNYSLQIFGSNTGQTKTLFGSPLLNLTVSTNEHKIGSCFVETEGMEAGDEDIFQQLHHRWQLDFFDSNGQERFVRACFTY